MVGGETPLQDSASGTDFSARCFVLGVWGALLLAALAFVAKYGRNVPVWDDWDMVPALTGQQPVTLSWLWEQQNEHRIFLPRLVLLALAKITHADFRAGMYFQVIVFGALALAMVLVARRLRGRAAYSDAFLPLVVLSLAQYPNFLLSIQVIYVLTTLLAGILLALLVGSGGQPGRAAVVVAGICLLLLPLCGAHGVVYVPVLALWLLYTGARYLRSEAREVKRNGLVLISFALAAILEAGFYFVGYSKGSAVPTSPSLWAALMTSVQLLSVSFGPRLGVAGWPYSGLILLGLFVFSGAALVFTYAAQPEERPRAGALLMFLAAGTCLVLAVGWGRAAMGPQAGFEARYVTFLIPALSCLYFIWEIYHREAIRSLMQICLFALACSVFWQNVADAVAFGSNRCAQAERLERDVRAGVPMYLLVRKYSPALFHPTHTRYMPLLHRAGIGVFRDLQENPAFREVSLPVKLLLGNQLRWETDTAHTTDVTSYLEFGLDKPALVCGIELHYRHANSQGTRPLFQMFWKGPEQQKFTDSQRYADHYPETGPGDHTLAVWIGETIERFRIYPDNQPCFFHISKIVLLVPEGPEPGERVTG
jgi:hypothetical protein